MDIVVCVKPVPDPKQWSKLHLDPVTKVLRREGIETVLNPHDKHALEAALQIRQAHGGRIGVVSMAPPWTQEVLRETLALGADEVLLLSDRAFAGADTWATVPVLAAGIRRWGRPDLVLCGAESVDGSTGQVGPQLAHLLGYASLSYVCGLEEVSPERIIAHWQVEEGYAQVEVQLPAVLTVTRECNQPRGLNLMGVVQARNKPLTMLTAADLDLDLDRCGLGGSPTQMGDMWMPESGRRQVILEGETEEVIQELIRRLCQVAALPE
ncbi:MAG: electron transfer flavoprotein subunit beta/FixA family protein [Chloroflexia bacterium]|nr:electron transfer flavoprotein subunit beta/FixA family protein [Chloroflexia bacterium]